MPVDGLFILAIKNLHIVDQGSLLCGSSEGAEQEEEQASKGHNYCLIDDADKIRKVPRTGIACCGRIWVILTKASRMKRVTGVGGIFFKCQDPNIIEAWYARNLGFQANKYGTNSEWRKAGRRWMRSRP
jgi:hypothetical protein